MSRLELSAVCRAIIDLLAATCRDDIFSKNGTLLILGPEDVSILERSVDWTTARAGLARELGKLIVSLNTLAYGLYTDVWANAAGDMCHGPYTLSDGRQLIIRDYVDLAPADLWNHCMDWEIRSVRILTCYRQGVNLEIDFYGNLTAESNLIDSLSCFAFVVDGHQLEVAALNKLIISVAHRAIAQNKAIRSLGFEEIKRKFLEAHCYTERDFLKLAGLDWRPSQSMYDAIGGKALLPGAEDWGDDRKLYAKALDAVVNP